MMESKFLWLPFLTQRKLQTIGILLCGLLASYCTLLLTLSIGKYMEIVFHSGGGKARALQLLGINLGRDLATFFLFFVAVMVVKFLSSWIHTYQSSLLSEHFVSGLRRQLIIEALNKPADEPVVTRPGKLISFGNDMKSMQNLLTKGVLGWIKDCLFLLMSLYVLVALQPLLSLTMLVLVGLFYAIHRWFNQSNKSLFKEKRNRQGALVNAISEAIIHQNQDVKMKQRAIDKKAERLQTVLKKHHFKKALLKAMTPLMLYLLLSVMMIMISLGNTASPVNPGDIITYILLLMTLFPTIRSIIKVEHTWVVGNLAAKKFAKASPDSAGIQKEIPGIDTKLSKSSYSLLHSDTSGQQ